MHKNLKKLIDNNLLCYDSQAELGKLTARLFGLMHSEYIKNWKEFGVPWEEGKPPSTLNVYYLPRELYFNSIPLIKSLAYVGHKIYYYTKDFLGMFKDYDATLATPRVYFGSSLEEHKHTDVYLIIGWDEKNGNGILGSC